MPTEPPGFEAQSELFTQVDINGTRLAYRDIGQGEPVVLSHETISDLRCWEPIENKFAERFRVITYSEAQADELAALIEKLDIAPTHMVDNSAGAFLALLVARRRPELLKKMVLEEPPVISIFLRNTPPTLMHEYNPLAVFEAISNFIEA